LRKGEIKDLSTTTPNNKTKEGGPDSTGLRCVKASTVQGEWKERVRINLNETPYCKREKKRGNYRTKKCRTCWD